MQYALSFGLLEVAHDAIIIHGLDGRIRYRNRELKFSTAGLSAKPSDNVSMNYFELRKTSEEFPVEISSSPIETDSGVLIATSIRDVSDRKNLEKMLTERNVQLRKADRGNIFLSR